MAQVTVAQTTVAQIILAQMKQLIWTGLNKFGSNEHGSKDLAQKKATSYNMYMYYYVYSVSERLSRLLCVVMGCNSGTTTQPVYIFNTNIKCKSVHCLNWSKMSKNKRILSVQTIVHNMESLENAYTGFS